MPATSHELSVSQVTRVRSPSLSLSDSLSLPCIVRAIVTRIGVSYGPPKPSAEVDLMYVAFVVMDSMQPCLVKIIRRASKSEIRSTVHMDCHRNAVKGQARTVYGGRI